MIDELKSVNLKFFSSRNHFLDLMLIPQRKCFVSPNGSLELNPAVIIFFLLFVCLVTSKSKNKDGKKQNKTEKMIDLLPYFFMGYLTFIAIWWVNQLILGNSFFQ